MAIVGKIVKLPIKKNKNKEDRMAYVWSPYETSYGKLK